MKKMMLLLYVLEFTGMYLIFGVIARFMLEAMYISGVHYDPFVELCSKLFEGPFVTLFGIW